MKPKLSPCKIKQIIEEKNLAKSDSRFTHVFKDGRYRNHQRQKDKLLLDKRFQKVEKDAYHKKSTRDHHGQADTFSSKADLMKFYRLDSSESEGQESDNEENSEIEEEDNDSITEGENLPKCAMSERDLSKKMVDMENDYAREAFFSDSSEDDSSSEDEELDSESTGIESESDSNEADVVETSRIALLNANWDYVRASDIMVMLSSFALSSSNVKKVSIYVSNYGKEKLKQEDEEGPQLFLAETDTTSVEYLDKLERGDVDDDGTLSDEQLRAFRKYEAQKLKYYYAIVDCDSVDTAITIYKQCDKSTIGTLGNSIDLRYVLEETEFDEAPIDICEGTPDSYEYEGCSAFDGNQNLNWDETNPRRVRIMENVMKKAMNGETIEDNALKDYIGSGSSEEFSDNEATISRGKKAKKFKKLLSRIDANGDLSDDDLLSGDSEDNLLSGDSEDDVHMTETFQVDPNQKLSEESEQDESNEAEENNDPSDKTDLELMLMDDNSDDNHFNMRDVIKESKKKQKIGRKKWEKMKIIEKRDNAKIDDFKINIEDERFSLIHDGQFNIEWSHPSYKRTILMDNLLTELPAKRRKFNEDKKLHCTKKS